MPRIEADFTQISSSFEPLPDGEYVAEIKKVEQTSTRESQLPMLKFELEVTEPAEFAGRMLFDNAVLQKKDRSPNKIGLGQLKAYFEATAGEEAANNPGGLDTDELVGNRVRLVVKQRSYNKPNADGSAGETQISNEIAKILPA